MENNTNNSAAQTPAQGAANASTSYNQGGAKKSSSILMIVFLITTLGFAGAFAWAMLRDNGNSNDNAGPSADIANQEVSSITQEQLENPEAGTIAEVVSDYNTDKEVRDLVREMRNKTYEYYYSVTSSYDDGVTVFDYDYLSRTSKSYGFRTTDNDIRDLGAAAGSTAVDFANSSIDQILSNHGFTKDSNGYFRKGDLVCMHSSYGNSLSVNCASTKWFTSADKEFADAVNALKNYNKDYYIGANTNVITVSEDGNYEKASVSVNGVGEAVGGHVDLFYRKIDGGEWTYITSTQGAPSCDDFDADAAAAYKGVLCSYQENGQWGNKYLGE